MSTTGPLAALLAAVDELLDRASNDWPEGVEERAVAAAAAVRAQLAEGLSDEQARSLCDCDANDGMTLQDVACDHAQVRAIARAVRERMGGVSNG